MNILYVVGSGSNWFDNELKYSLRSIEKNGINVDNVFIVGEKPRFINEDKVKHIYCFDKFGFGQKHNNIHYKVEYAMNTGMLGDHFLISSDDHFYIKPTDFDAYPVYFRNKEIPTKTPEGVKPSIYWYSLFETRKFLLKKGLPIYQTNPHANTHIDVNLWRDNTKLFNEAMKIPYGGEINCIMGNLMIANGVEPQRITDCKVFKYKTEEQLKEKIADNHVFSIDDGAIECGIGRYLGNLFPDKCSYER